MFKDKTDVAIIDDGVNEKLFNIGCLKHNIEIVPELKVLPRRGYDKHRMSHATICAGIIRKYGRGARLSSIKILNDKKRGLREQLIKSLDWCTEAGIRIVNLSLGSIHHEDSSEIQNAVNRVVMEGLIVVAACSNNKAITYPACLPNVIGVKQDATNRLKEGEYIFNACPQDGIDITTCGRHLLVQPSGEVYCTDGCSSYAAPVITAKVYEIVDKHRGITLEEIRTKLIEGALNKGNKV